MTSASIRPARKSRPDNKELMYRIGQLMRTTRFCQPADAAGIYDHRMATHMKPWMAGRSMPERLIGWWAECNSERWTFWHGASPQLKDWNHTHPPIRSMQIDLGLTDEQTNYLFRNPKITTFPQLQKAVLKVKKEIEAKCKDSSSG